MLLTAIHSIRRRVEGVRETIDPNQVFEADRVEGEGYLATDAAREPTVNEAALYNLGKPNMAKVAAPAPEPTPVVEPAKNLMKVTPKKQGDVYVAVDEVDTVVSGQETFATKADCAAWIKANPIEADPNAGLLE